jgi:hypothetical protein
MADKPTPVKNLKGSVLSISHSARDTWMDCHRKWWYSYMERRRGADKESTITGGRVHECAEDYLNGKTTLEEGLAGEWRRYWRILEPALVHAPSPADVASGEWAVETRVDTPCGPLPFKGFVDINTTELWLAVEVLRAQPHPIIDDWKTTGVPGWRYTKDKYQLAKHGQPLAYAYALHHADPPEAVVFRHHNMYTKGKPGPDTIQPVVSDPVPWATIESFWNEVMIPAAEAMHKVATTATTAEQVPGTTANCKKYGGCDHALVCALSPLNRTKVIVTPNKEPTIMANTEEAQKKLAAMRAKLGLPPLQAQAAPAVITPTPPKAAPDPYGADHLARLSHTRVVEQIKSMVAAMPSGLPHAVAETVAKSNNVELGAVLNELKLYVNAEGQVLPAVATVQVVRGSSAGIVKTGTNVEEALAQWPGMTIEDIAKVSGLKQVFGLLVPKDFEGAATKAYRLYRPGTPEAQVAEVLETVDPTPPAPTPQPPKLQEVEVSPAPSPQPSDPSGSPSTETPTPPTGDINAAIAAALIEAILGGDNPLSKPSAAVLAREVDPTIQRVRKSRWDLVIAASQGQLQWEGDSLGLVPGETYQGHAPEGELLVDVFDEDEEDEAPTGWAEIEAAGGLEPEAPVDFPIEVVTYPHPDPRAHGLAEVYEDVIVEDATLTLRPATFVPDYHEVFINCYPAGESYTSFGKFMAQFTYQVFKLRAALDTNGPAVLPRSLVLEDTAPDADRIIQMLESLPDVRIIRGAR